MNDENSRDNEINTLFNKQLEIFDKIHGAYTRDYYVFHREIFCDVFFNKNLWVNTYENDESMSVCEDDTDICARINTTGLYYFWKVYDYDKAFDCWSVKCLENNKIALDHLGTYYWKVKNDYERAIECFEKACGLGNCNSMFNLGMYYSSIEKNDVLMSSYLVQAIKNGHVEAMFALGLFHSVQKNYDEMKHYWSMAFEHGHLGVIYYLGLYYMNEGHDVKLGIKYLKLAVEKGDAKSMVLLAKHYLYKKNNKNLGKHYCTMAVEKGSAEGMCIMGIYYFSYEFNQELMIKYLVMASKKGNPQAMTLLGLHYSSIGNIDCAFNHMVGGLKHGDYSQLNIIVELIINGRIETRYENLRLVCSILLSSNDPIKYFKELEHCGVEKINVMRILNELRPGTNYEF